MAQANSMGTARLGNWQRWIRKILKRLYVYQVQHGSGALQHTGEFLVAGTA